MRLLFLILFAIQLCLIIGSPVGTVHSRLGMGCCWPFLKLDSAAPTKDQWKRLDKFQKSVATASSVTFADTLELTSGIFAEGILSSTSSVLGNSTSPAKSQTTPPAPPPPSSIIFPPITNNQPTPPASLPLSSIYPPLTATSFTTNSQPTPLATTIPTTGLSPTPGTGKPLVSGKGEVNIPN
jgi:hypothetical protein